MMWLLQLSRQRKMACQATVPIDTSEQLPAGSTAPSLTSARDPDEHNGLTEQKQKMEMTVFQLHFMTEQIA